MQNYLQTELRILCLGSIYILLIPLLELAFKKLGKVMGMFSIKSKYGNGV